MSGHDISLANNMSGHDINAVSENEQMAFYAIPNYSSSNKKDELKEILDRVAPDYERALKIIKEKQAEIECLAADFSNESERLKRDYEKIEKEMRKLKQEIFPSILLFISGGLI